MIDIRYASIRSMDISNGEGVGVALFVQGCNFHCYNCFNPDTWDFNGGKEWTKEKEEEFIRLADKPYIKRISILGGEPLADENFNDIFNLLHKIRLSFGQTKKIWLYTGYTYEEIQSTYKEKIIPLLDVIIDGRFVDSLKDMSLKFRGSSNQRIINIDRKEL